MRQFKYAVLVLWMFLTALPASAQTVKIGDREIDSVLLAYFSRCNKITRSPELLPTADTLFRLAGAKGDTRMQAAAISYKVDHFFYTGPKDSMTYWIARGKEFCRRHKQLTHYYYMWNRLVSWHIKRSETTLALNELRQIQTQATRDDFKQAIGDSYRRLGEIYYSLKKNIPAAIEQYEKAIDFYQTNDLDSYNLLSLYNNTAAAYAATKLYDRALSILDSAEEKIVMPQQRYHLKLRRLTIYLLMNDTKRAAPLLQECLRAEQEGTLPSTASTSLRENEAIYYLATRQPRKALQILDRQVEYLRTNGYNPENYSSYLLKMLTAARMLGDTTTYFRTDSLYHTTMQIISNEQSNNALGEFTAMLDVERLNRENAEMELAAQQQKLRYNILVIFVLAGVLVISIVFGIVQSRTSRRLRHSRQALLDKNKELERSEESLRIAKNEAEQASRMKSVFIRNVTHEIHTPLNAIVGFAPLVADKIAPYDQEARAYMEIVQDNSRYLQKLVEDVLTLSDMESLAGAPALETADIDSICRRSIERAGKGHPGVEISYRACGLKLRTNALCLSQVLTNLLHNALKFTLEGRIELACETAGDRVQFTVTDTGPGIPKGEGERIFERFVKLDPHSQGMGLGLAVCRLIVEKLGGTIFLDASRTEGSRFVVRLPLRP